MEHKLFDAELAEQASQKEMSNVRNQRSEAAHRSTEAAHRSTEAAHIKDVAQIDVDKENDLNDHKAQLRNAAFFAAARAKLDLKNGTASVSSNPFSAPAAAPFAAAPVPAPAPFAAANPVPVRTKAFFYDKNQIDSVVQVYIIKTVGENVLVEDMDHRQLGTTTNFIFETMAAATAAGAASTPASSPMNMNYSAPAPAFGAADAAAGTSAFGTPSTTTTTGGGFSMGTTQAKAPVSKNKRPLTGQERATKRAEERKSGSQKFKDKQKENKNNKN